MRTHPTFLIAIAATILLSGCSTGNDKAPGTEEGSIRPCNDGQPAFDVWRADFAPNGRTTITAQVDTSSSATAAEFRLTLDCQGKIVATAIDGRACSDDPPKIAEGNDPECPLITIAVDDLDFANDTDGRIECFAEIGVTEALEIGTGGCADPATADYRLRMQIDAAALALDLVDNDCRDDKTCL